MKSSTLGYLGIGVVLFALGIWMGDKYGQRFVKSAQPASPSVVQSSPQYSVFLITLNDGSKNGPVGCGDFLVADGVSNPKNPTEALTELLALKQQNIAAIYGSGSYYDSLYQSTLKIQNVSPNRIDLTGNFNLGGECDNPRVEAQLNATVHQFPGYENTPIYVNGKLLHDALSLKG